MTSAPCPICDDPVGPDADHFPFCSLRCKQRDLGNWFDGVYRIAGDDDEESDDEEESYGGRHILPPPDPDGYEEE